MIIRKIFCTMTKVRRKEKHFENRFKLNCYYDKYLPISAYEAERMGFIKLSYDESKFHMPAGIKNELQKVHLINI